MNPDATATLAPLSNLRPTSKVRRAVTTAVLGQILEWYDFFLYGTAAALVFGHLFFPIGTDPLTGTIAAFGGFTVGFIARPIGGVLCGHIGDRYGRKTVMMLTLLMMGSATVCMGLLPTYQQIGIVAPIMLVLLRIVQGFALGGESAGANVLSTEVGPDGRRGNFVSKVTSGIFLAWILADRQAPGRAAGITSTMTAIGAAMAVLAVGLQGIDSAALLAGARDRGRRSCGLLLAEVDGFLPIGRPDVPQG